VPRLPRPPAASPLSAVVLYAALLAALIAISTPRHVGDSHDYVLVAENLSRFEPATASTAQVAELNRTTGVDWRAAHLVLPHADRYEFSHFFAYPLLAVPGVWLARLAGVSVIYGFALLNAALLLAAFRVAVTRLRRSLVVFLFVGPAIWWVDKAHTEAFTFALLVIAFTLVRERPGWSMAALGLAATQNPPIAVAIPLVAAVNWRALRRREVWLGGVAGVALAAAHPIYYEARLGVLTPTTLGDTHLHIPSAAQMWPFVGDLNIGLLPSFPVVLVLAVGAAIALARRDRRALVSSDVLVPLALALFFLGSFAQNVNVNNGGTPGMTRYGIWLIPLLIPPLRRAADSSRRFASLLAPAALVGAVWALVAFNPARGQHIDRPTALARFVWDHEPALDNPLAEVFEERLLHADGVRGPAATPSCSKALLVGGMWPATCRTRPQPPPACLRPGALCYANRDGAGYSFRGAPSIP
jgi:hypothetical protein